MMRDIVLWQGGSASMEVPATKLDVLFCHAGAIQRSVMGLPPSGWGVYGGVPERLPSAREYWWVVRFDGEGMPEAAALPDLRAFVSRLVREARWRGLDTAGIQLDIDWPTGALTQYASFLREFRKELSPGIQISITALLDWFRPGTAIGQVVKEIEEFVPQFYDVGDRYGRKPAISTRIDARKWGPVFNRHGKRFRIGISTFGRSRLVRPAPPSGSRYSGLALAADVRPLDLAIIPVVDLKTSFTNAGELVLSYEARQKVPFGYGALDAGDRFEFVVPTPEGIKAAVDQAKAMGGYCGGVLFFRWPAFNEVLAMQPAEALRAAGVVPASAGAAELREVDGHCAAVSCVDLYLTGTPALDPRPLRFRIRSSVDLEYFLPAERMPVRMARPRELVFPLPAYCGGARMHLGRAVTAERARFTLQEEAR